jgi:hypothetical protein
VCVKSGFAVDAHLARATGIVHFAGAAMRGGLGDLAILGSPEQFALEFHRPATLMLKDRENGSVCRHPHARSYNIAGGK